MVIANICDELARIFVMHFQMIENRSRSTVVPIILVSFSSSQVVNFTSTSSSVNAPFLKPSNKWFFNKTPLYDKIARAVSVGISPFCNQFKAASKFISIWAGFVLGLYIPIFSINLIWNTK